MLENRTSDNDIKLTKAIYLNERSKTHPTNIYNITEITNIFSFVSNLSSIDRFGSGIVSERSKRKIILHIC